MPGNHLANIGIVARLDEGIASSANVVGADMERIGIVVQHNDHRLVPASSRRRAASRSGPRQHPSTRPGSDESSRMMLYPLCR